MAPSNIAAILPEAKARPFTLQESPIGTPGPSQILIKNHALAIQPVDGLLQTYAFMPLKYPAILGIDVAGTVEQVGPQVTRFKPGDRVISSAHGGMGGVPAQGGFQHFTVCEATCTARLPDEVRFQDAVVLPCCLSAAAGAFFRKAPYLELRKPALPKRESQGETVLVWGAASAVGNNAIQLAVAAGYEVVATASEKNFSLVKKLGASNVVDYKASDAVEQVSKALAGKRFVGALDCIGPPATPLVVQAIKDVKGGVKRIITTKPPEKTNVDGVEIVFVDGNDFVGYEDGALANEIYSEFLEQALREQQYVTAPEAVVVGKGMEKVQEAVDLVQKGMSARKAVVLL